MDKKTIKNNLNSEYRNLSVSKSFKSIFNILLKIIYLLKEYKYQFAIGFSSLVISSILGIISVLYLKNSIDTLSSNGINNMNTFINNIILLCIYISLSILFSFIGSSILAVVSQKSIYKLRNRLFEHTQNLPINFFDKHNAGKLISIYVNDVELLSTVLDQSIPKILISLIQITFTVVILLYLNVFLGIITSILLFGYLIFIATLSLKAKKYTTLRQHYLAIVNGYAEQGYSSIAMIRSYGYSQKYLDEFKEKMEYLKYSSEKSQLYTSLMYQFSNIFFYILFGIVALIGGNLAFFGFITIGSIVSYIQLVRNLSDPILIASTQLNTLLSSISGAEFVFNILKTNSEIDQTDKQQITIKIVDGIKYWKNGNKLIKANGHIEFKNVNFSYLNNDKKETNLTLKNISLYAKPSQKISFVGSTGAGKTTIANLVNRFYEINNGDILIDGINIKEINKNSLRSQITTVLQESILFSGSIADNIRYGNLLATDEEVKNAAILSNADEFIQKLPDKYNTIINPDDLALSQGEIQLLSIARAAVSKPLILILDEATSSIDSQTEKLIQDGIDKLMNECTTLVIAHRLSTIKNSNAILVLENGNIIERGDHDNLLSQKGLYYDLHTGKNAIS